MRGLVPSGGRFPFTAYLLKAVKAWRLFRILPCLAIIFFSVLEPGSSQSGSGTAAISTVPVWGQDGVVTGYVYGVASDQVRLYVFEFIPDFGWYPLAGCTPVQI